MRIRRILAEAAVVACGTLFWLAMTAFVGLPVREDPLPAEAASPAPGPELPDIFFRPGPFDR